MLWLDMVRGLVRPCSTMAVILAIMYLTIMGELPADHLVTMGSMMVAFWFGQRDKPPGEGNGA